jgi:histidinol-phosphate aminotransferase
VILAPAPSFVMYRASAALNHVDYVEVDLVHSGDGFALDALAMVTAIETHRPALVYLPFPNNPTGAQFDRADMVAVIEAAHQRQAFVVVDEAYQPFASYTWMNDLAEFENLLVMRTVSKLGLAGVRLGYMVGRADVIAELDKVRPPYNINVLTEAAVTFVLQHADVLEQQAKQIRATRSELLTALRSMPKLQVFDSDANFVLVRFNDADAAFKGLKARGILVKNMSRAHPLLKNCLRLTVGSVGENQSLVDAIRML